MAESTSMRVSLPLNLLLPTMILADSAVRARCHGRACGAGCCIAAFSRRLAGRLRRSRESSQNQNALCVQCLFAGIPWCSTVLGVTCLLFFQFDAQDVEDLLASGGSPLRVEPQLGRQAELRALRAAARRQEAAVAAERAESDAVIEDLRDQLREGRRGHEGPEKSEEHAGVRENAELQAAVADLRAEAAMLTQQLEEMRHVAPEVHSDNLVVAIRRDRRCSLQQLLDFQKRFASNYVIRLAMLAWRIRTAALSAKISERARLRLECRDRVAGLIEAQSNLHRCFDASDAFRAWAQAVLPSPNSRKQTQHKANSRIRLLRCLQAWRRIAALLGSLRNLTWVEPATVCSPEFASATLHDAHHPRVYRAVLLPTLGRSANVPCEKKAETRSGLMYSKFCQQDTWSFVIKHQEALGFGHSSRAAGSLQTASPSLAWQLAFWLHMGMFLFVLVKKECQKHRCRGQV